MKTVAVEDTTLTAEDLARLAENEPIILTREGQPLVSVKGLSGSDWESVSLANDPTFIAIIEESRQSYRKQGGISLTEIREELGLRKRRKTSGKRREAKK